MGGLSRREKILLIALGVAVIGFLYYSYVLTPQLKNLRTAEGNLQKSKARLEELRAQQRDIDILRKEVDDLTVKANEATKSVPDTDRMPDLIINLTNITSSSGCTAGALGFGDPQSLNLKNSKNSSQNGGQNQNGNQDQKLPSNVTDGVVVILPMTYQVSGNYTNVVSMLKLMENNERKMMVTSIAMNKDTKTGGIAANISFNSLCRKLGDSSEPVSYPFSNIPVGKVDLFN